MTDHLMEEDSDSGMDNTSESQDTRESDTDKSEYSNQPE